VQSLWDGIVREMRRGRNRQKLSVTLNLY